MKPTGNLDVPESAQDTNRARQRGNCELPLALAQLRLAAAVLIVP